MAEKVYSIKDLETISGIKAHTIRIWERRYRLLSPLRTDTNIRIYSDTDLRRLMNVATLLGRKYKISKIAGLGDDKLRDLVLLPSKGQEGARAEIIGQMTLYMLHFDGPSFSLLLEQVIEKSGFGEAATEIIFPFLQKVGTFWQVGSVVPAHEHLVTGLIRHRFIFELTRAQSQLKEGKVMVSFLHEEEMHDLLLLYYSVLAAQKGYRILYLGQNVPVSDLEHLSGIDGITHALTVFTNALETRKTGRNPPEAGRSASRQTGDPHGTAGADACSRTAGRIPCHRFPGGV